jgi:hypothetical protein
MASTAFVPASVMGPVSGPRSASTSRKDRVGGRKRPVCAPTPEPALPVEDLPADVLLCALAMLKAYRDDLRPMRPSRRLHARVRAPARLPCARAHTAGPSVALPA